jgi:hypothetical protein
MLARRARDDAKAGGKAGKAGKNTALSCPTADACPRVLAKAGAGEGACRDSRDGVAGGAGCCEGCSEQAERYGDGDGESRERLASSPVKASKGGLHHSECCTVAWFKDGPRLLSTTLHKSLRLLSLPTRHASRHTAS